MVIIVGRGRTSRGWCGGLSTRARGGFVGSGRGLVHCCGHRLYRSAYHKAAKDYS